ncbi:hypothetical protein D3C73_1551400 [compost metagenome]
MYRQLNLGLIASRHFIAAVKAATFKLSDGEIVVTRRKQGKLPAILLNCVVPA